MNKLLPLKSSFTFFKLDGNSSTTDVIIMIDLNMTHSKNNSIPLDASRL